MMKITGSQERKILQLFKKSKTISKQRITFEEWPNEGLSIEYEYNYTHH